LAQFDVPPRRDRQSGTDDNSKSVYFLVGDSCGDTAESHDRLDARRAEHFGTLRNFEATEDVSWEKRLLKNPDAIRPPPALAIEWDV
jgi:hypothetical protein